jgi:type IV pilus assembly protein PilM
VLPRHGATTGIDIGHRAIKLVRLENGGGAPLRLTHWGVQELPPSDDVSLQDRSAALRRLLGRLRLRPRLLGRVAAAVGGKDVYLRQASMPRLAPDDLRKALPYEARKHLPLENLSQPCLDFQILDGVESGPAGDDPETQEVLLVAVPAKRRNEVLETLIETGIDPDVLDAQPLPAVNAVLGAHLADSEKGWMVILDLGASSSTVTAILPDGSFYSRPLEFAGQALTRRVEHELGLDLPDAEILKRELEEREAGPVRTAIDEPLRDLVRALGETIRFLRVRRRELPVGRLYLCGGGALLAGIREHLASALQIEVIHPDPFRDVAGESGPRPDWREVPWLIGALGLARWWE